MVRDSLTSNYERKSWGGGAVLDGSRSLVRGCTIAEEPVSEVVGRFYIVLSSTLEQAHCVCDSK